MAGHGVQAATKHRARQQVHNRLEAAGVDHGGVERHHDCDVDQVRRPCCKQAESVMLQTPRYTSTVVMPTTPPRLGPVTKATHTRTAAAHTTQS